MPSVPLSIVVPCYNEEGCLAELHRRLSAAARAVTGDAYEIVLINDGSKDRTWPIMQELAEQDPHLVAINLSRNHGHQLALTAGLDLCAGERILIIDADLQDPPELLGDMMEAMVEQQADVVYAVRRARAGETRFKRGTAKAFYRILFKLSEIEIPLDTGDFRLMSRRALDALLALPEQARFIRGMVAWVGFKQVPILYDRAERHAGETNYPLRKMLRLAIDAITGFSTAPLRFASHVGLWLVAASILLIVYIAIGFFTGSAIQGWTSLMLVVVILGAVQMFVLGMIGEYLGRVYVEAKKRPLYIVAEIAGQAGGKPRLGHVSGQGPVRPLAAPPQEPTRSPPAKRRASSAAGRSRAAPGRKSSRTKS
jgi:polyisoprenyl-phosphate glycosyltransferase